MSVNYLNAFVSHYWQKASAQRQGLSPLAAPAILADAAVPQAFCLSLVWKQSADYSQGLLLGSRLLPPVLQSAAADQK